MFERIKNDKELIEIYERINDIENKTNAWAHHDYKHVLNVAKLIEQVLSELNYSKDLIEEAKIAAILHDVGSTTGKDGHAERSYNYAKDYIDRKNIKLKYKDDVLEAIRIHSNGFNTNNIIALSLILADKLDITKERVAEYGKQVKGMRQLLYIEKVDIKIDKNKMEIRFIVNDNINFQELEEFEFMQKVLKSIDKFSEFHKLSSKIYLNNTYIIKA